MNTLSFVLMVITPSGHCIQVGTAHKMIRKGTMATPTDKCIATWVMISMSVNIAINIC